MQESYKSFIKQKIWIFIMILLVIRMVSVCITGYDSHYMIDENEINLNLIQWFASSFVEPTTDL